LFGSVGAIDHQFAPWGTTDNITSMCSSKICQANSSVPYIFGVGRVPQHPCNAPRTYNFLIPRLIPSRIASALAMENEKLSTDMAHYLALCIQHNNRRQRHSLVGNRSTAVCCVV
jgi:hypothetical protein